MDTLWHEIFDQKKEREGVGDIPCAISVIAGKWQLALACHGFLEA